MFGGRYQVPALPQETISLRLWREVQHGTMCPMPPPLTPFSVSHPLPRRVAQHLVHPCSRLCFHFSSRFCFGPNYPRSRDVWIDEPGEKRGSVCRYARGLSWIANNTATGLRFRDSPPIASKHLEFISLSTSLSRSRRSRIIQRIGCISPPPPPSSSFSLLALFYSYWLKLSNGIQLYKYKDKNNLRYICRGKRERFYNVYNILILCTTRLTIFFGRMKFIVSYL